MKKKATKKVRLSVVGMQHRVTMSTRRMMAAHIKENGPLTCVLKRERHNSHDENAIMVLVAEGPYERMQIGYLRRGVAAVYAKLMDREEIVIDDANLVEVWPQDGEGELLVYVKANAKVLERAISDES